MDVTESAPLAGAELADRELVMRFESLGGHGHGCEFGLFQRHFGAEPLGLLRWADLGPDLVTKALEQRFKGVGAAKNTIIFNPDDSDEWWTRDTRYWMAMRSFVKVAAVSQHTMAVQIRRRQGFLARKLIEDLKAGEKIFVFKSMFRNLTDVEISRLHAAVRAYGDATLFYVRYPDETHPAGTVEVKSPGLMIGYIKHFQFSPEDKLIGSATHLWYGLCQQAYRLFLAKDTEKLPEKVVKLRKRNRKKPAQDQPGDPALLIQSARQAFQARDWDEAIRLWAEVRSRLPDNTAGYTGGAQALKQAGRADEADALLVEAARIFPNDPSVLIERGWLALHRKDWVQGERLFTIARERFPDHVGAYSGGMLALRELRRYAAAEELASQAIARFPDERNLRIDQAWLAQVANDWAAAAERWSRIRTELPDLQAGYIQGARALREAWKHDEAEALLTEAITRFPDAIEPASEYAWIALHQNRWDEAQRRFQHLRDQYPNAPDGWQGGAKVLRNQFKLAEAASMLEEAMARFPTMPEFMLDHAQLPVAPAFAHEKDWPETVRRIARLHEVFPTFEAGLLTGIRLLQQAGQPDDAEALAGTASARLPNSHALAIQSAEAAERRHDWPEAIARYTSVKDRFPHQPGGEVGLARALAGVGRFPEAETMLRETMTRFPANKAPFAEYADLAMRQENWAEALHRWTQATDRFPEERSFAHRAYDARMRLSEADPAASAVMQLPAAPMPDPDSTDQNVRDLVMQFESLGGRGLGCEFGIFQRDCGAEPLGLLSWADMPFDMLLFTLRNRFDGVGSDENTELFVSSVAGGRGEYCTRDLRGMMFMRAFVYEDQVPFEKMRASALNRLRFLTRKLVEDLEQGTKIFVFRLTDRNLTPAEIDELHAAVRGYGDNTLLYVRYEDETHPNGTVEAVKPGLLIGYMDRFKMSRTDQLFAAPPTGSWLAVCRAAYALWRSERADPPSAPAVITVSHKRRVVLLGNCQAQSMAQLYRRFVGARTGDIIDHVASYEDVTPAARRTIEQADIIVEQLFDLKQQAETGGLAATTPRLFIPMVTGGFLWPFAGQPHPKNREYPWMAGGPYGGEASDSYLNRLIMAGVSPEEAVETYANLDVNSRVKLDRLYELIMDRQRSRDAAADYQIADVIEQNFRTEQVFLSPYHPNLRVALSLATQFFRQMGAEQEDIDRLHNNVRVTPFPKTELPLHPGVCRHFGLTCVPPDRRYRFMNEGSFTFREYALRYMKYEWNEALEEGMSLAHAGQREAARVRLTEGLARSPDSAPGHSALGHILGQMGDTDAATAEARRAAEIEPESGPYHAALGGLLRLQGRLDEAEAELLTAILADPTETHHYVLLAHLFGQRREFRESCGLIRQTLELDPYSARLHSELAYFADAAGDLADAVQALQRAVALAPDNAAYHQRLAVLLGRAGQPGAAAEAARTADALSRKPPEPASESAPPAAEPGEAPRREAALEPANPQSHVQLAEKLVAANDFSGAEAALRDAVNLAPRNYLFHVLLSDLLARRGRRQEALEEAQTAFDVAPDSAQALGHLAHVTQLVGDLARAFGLYQDAIAMAPDNTHLRNQFAALQERQARAEAV